ncbi:MAG: UDP-glucose/GDP-mannose dehydrogenase family protein [Candidatus Pacebacteria bacterium]|nr:UDP-glucose/GDP-mannose dehydrogenase family protein [Candidatus Paceibacterota bacterium]PIR60775.1 MAG: UDP-glucose 6-dehydrogenase [Candidatus Pacebacteria bacterium CG10_big_fil_rev_8_21_14_0_10_44_54]
MKITVIGTGFVGVVTAAVYASFGNEAIGLDIDEAKVKSLGSGIVPFHEPGLSELLSTELESGHLSFTTSYEAAISNSDIIVIAVGTPSKPDGSADLSYVLSAARSLAPFLTKDAVVVVKSTVPPGTLQTVAAEIQAKTAVAFDLASVPEFLKEGTAVEDTLRPDRIVIGADSPEAIERLKALHAPLKAPVVVVSANSAQMSKYAANAYLATRITFINQIANLCEAAGADVQEVISAMGLDRRIGSHYWYPGLGYGGSCFPKDVRELAHFAEQQQESPSLFSLLSRLNETRVNSVFEHWSKIIGKWQDKKVAVLGLSFKPNTDDTRDAPSLQVIPWLLKHGARVVGFDPKATAQVRTLLGEQSGLQFADSTESAVANADVILVLIEWAEFILFDFAKTKEDKIQFFLDARNQFDPTQITSSGYTYAGIARRQS